MAIRIRSHFHRGAGERTMPELAGVIAMLGWKLSQEAIRRMRAAQFDIDIGAQYFAFLREWLVFLIQVADRMAHERMGADERVVFTTALVRRVADHLADNEDRLLGVPPPGEESHQDRFIDLFNMLSSHYADFGHGADGPDFAFMRYLGHRLEALMPKKDQNWVVDQVMAIEAPEAVEMLQRSLHGLLSNAPRAPRRAGVSGD